MQANEALARMVAPGQKRPGIWHHGICQIVVTRACNLSCVHCSQASNLGGKATVMTPEEFEQAVDSLDGYFGVYATFGGNPAMSPYFEDYARILRAKVPFARRGLWCNALRGKGAIARVTWNPAVSNLNVHLDGEAHAEFVRDWPESAPYLKGMEQDSVHSSPWVAIKDMVPDEELRWEHISKCDINRYWSAAIGVVPGRGLRAYFCEVAYSQAVMHATLNPDDPNFGDVGMEVVPGWWRRPMADFEAQVRQHCHACGIPMRRQGQGAIHGTHEEFSETHRAIARPKKKDRPVEFVDSLSIGRIERGERPSTQYLAGVTPGYKGD